MAKFLYRSIPQYSKEILDILRDVRTVNGEQVNVKPLEEYLDNIDTITFDAIKEYIRNILNLNDIDRVPERYLPYLAYLLGHKWDYELDVDYQKLVLKNIVQLYKRKGTKFYIHYNAAYFDPNVNITENYGKIFTLNKSKLDSEHVFANEEYQWGVYSLSSDADPETLRKIITRTKPAGFKAIYNYAFSMTAFSGTRIDDSFWQNLKKTNWYTNVYLSELHNYIMWGDLSLLTGNLLYEDLAGYFIRGNGKVLDVPFSTPLNTIDNVSSTKKSYFDMLRGITLRDETQPELYTGQTLLSNSLYTINQLGSESLIDTTRTTDKTIVLGSSSSKIADSSVKVGIADRHYNGSLFKNFIHFDESDSATIGPLVTDVDSVALGDKVWLEYDKSNAEYKNSFSVYLGPKPFVWSSTSANFTDPINDLWSFGEYTFKNTESAPNYYLYKAFSPKKYSRPILYGCKLIDGISVDSDELILSNYDDLPYEGTLVFNDEFVSYRKIINNQKYSKLYIDGQEIQQALKRVDSFVYSIEYSVGTTKYKFEVDKKSDYTFSVQFYANDNIQIENVDYTVVTKTNTTVLLRRAGAETQVTLRVIGNNPSDWIVLHNSVKQIFEANLVKHAEYLAFTHNNIDYELEIDKTDSNVYYLNLVVNNLFVLKLGIDYAENTIKSYLDSTLLDTIPIDQPALINGYSVKYSEDTREIVLENITNVERIGIYFGSYAVKNSHIVTINRANIADALITILSDRLDGTINLLNNKRAIYAPIKDGRVIQVFYATENSRLQVHKDYEYSILLRSIEIEDKELKKKIRIEYKSAPSIQITGRFKRVLGFGVTDSSKSMLKHGDKPRLLSLTDEIDFRRKMHKINDMEMQIFEYEWPTTYIPLGNKRIPSLPPDSEHNSVYVYNNKKYAYVCKYDELLRARDEEYSITYVVSTVEEFEALNANAFQNGDKIRRFTTEEDPYFNYIYIKTDNGIEFYDVFENFMLDRDIKYTIAKTFVSVREMTHYQGNDIGEGRYVLIQMPAINSKAMTILPMHNNSEIVYANAAIITEADEFMGHQIIAPFIHNIGRHINTHILDRKYISDDKRKAYSLTLGQKFPLDGAELESQDEKYDITLGGTGNQNRMALNKSQYIYDHSSWHLAGGPVISLNGSSYTDEIEKSLHSFVLGQRKLLGGRVIFESEVKYPYSIEISMIKTSNNVDPRVESEVQIETYLAYGPGILVKNLALIKNEDLYRLPIRFVDQKKEADFTTDKKKEGNLGTPNNPVNASGRKYQSIENHIYAAIDAIQIGTEPVTTGIKASILGKKYVLGTKSNYERTDIDPYNPERIVPIEEAMSFVTEIDTDARVLMAPRTNLSTIAYLNQNILYRLPQNVQVKKTEYSLTLGDPSKGKLSTKANNLESSQILFDSTNVHRYVEFDMTVSSNDALIIGKKENTLGRRLLLGSSKKK